MAKINLEVSETTKHIVCNPDDGATRRYRLSPDNAYDMAYALLNVCDFSQEQGETLRDLLGVRFPYPPAE